MNNLLQDLRFVIGAFFLIVAIIVITAGFMIPPPPEAQLNLNLSAGFGFLFFSIVMLALAIMKRNRP